MRQIKEAVTQPTSLKDNETRHAHNTRILLATIVLGTMMATQALAAGRSATGVYGNVFHNSPPPSAFQGPVITAPAMPPPVFNPSVPYTVPQAPEVRVSPASPGSVFSYH